MADIYSDIKLEQYVLNELSVEEARKLECAANSNEALRKRLEAIQYSNTAIESSINEQEVLREINYRIKNNKIRNEQQKTKKNRHSSWGRLAYAMPIVAMVAVSGLIMKETILTPVTPDFYGTEDGVRFKGLQPHINIYQQIEGGTRQLNSLTTLRQGDSLQLSYVAAGQHFGVIFSIDGRGALTQHYPLADQSALNLNASGEFMLKRSYQLDDAPKFEHFFFISSNTKFDLKNVIEAAQKSSPAINESTASISGLPDNLNQFVLTIKKAEQ